MEKEISKEYTNNQITVVWKPKSCIHAEECVKALPKVYQPDEKPWIQIDNTTTEELKSQIRKCPSGALSFYMNGKKNKQEESLETKVEVLENGPLLVYGTLRVTNKEGLEEVKNKTTAFCRCGASSNKPYCDGAHMKIKFEG
jgi:uncharacterized Fe-S cluster protein YjdI